MRNSPMPSFGLKINKPGYHPEIYKDFIGKDSPGHKYFPTESKVKRMEPSYSLPKFDRFHKPGTLAKL